MQDPTAGAWLWLDPLSCQSLAGGRTHVTARIIDGKQMAEDIRGEVAAGGEAGYIDALRVAAEPLGVRVDPGDRTADLVAEYRQIAADVLYPGEIR